MARIGHADHLYRFSYGFGLMPVISPGQGAGRRRSRESSTGWAQAPTSVLYRFKPLQLLVYFFRHLFVSFIVWMHRIRFKFIVGKYFR